MFNLCPTPGIAQWLRNTHTQLNSGSSSPTWIVLGNESADLDSAVSSIIFAYCLQMIAVNIIAIPLLPIPRADFKLRTEIVKFFQLLQLEEQFLYFSEDLPKFSPNVVQRTNNFGSPNIGMVDFNKLTPSLQYLSPHIKAVIDHHLPDAGLYKTAKPRIIMKAGSAASLVIQSQQYQIQRLLPMNLRKELATLAMGAILIDTANLNENIGRTEPVDINAMETIRSWISQPINEAELYATLSQAKSDLGRLNTDELLRKDFKEYELNGSRKYGIASVNWDFNRWIHRDNAQQLYTDANLFAKNRNLIVLFIMTTVEENNAFVRQLAVIGQDQQYVQRITDRIISNAPDVGLRLDHVPSGSLFSVFHMSSSMSRKKLQPLLQPIMESV